MYIRMVWGRLRRGGWDDYEQYYKEKIVPPTPAIKGLRERQLLRSTDDPDEGMSLSIWDSQEDMLKYERSKHRQTLAKGNEHLYQGDYWVKHFEIHATDNYK